MGDTEIKLLQYENLRKHFRKLCEDILGNDYYNEGQDVYACDRFTCRDILGKYEEVSRRWWHVFLPRKR